MRTLRFREVTSATWPDFVHLFEGKGCPSYCWCMAWRSLPGADVANRGRVVFRPAPGGQGSEICVELSYDPPAGAIGTTIAKLFGREPSQQVSADLRRLKQVLETGEVLHSDASIHRGMHPARPELPANAHSSHAHSRHTHGKQVHS